MANGKKNTVLFIATAAGAVAVDQLLKILVVAFMEPGRSITVIPAVLDITFTTNTGAAFGLLKGSGQLIFLVATVVVVLILAWFFYTRHSDSTWSFIALGMVIGGALGNVIDRICRGKVVDFVDLGWWPVFNFADMAIVAGVILFAAVTALEIMKEQ